MKQEDIFAFQKEILPATAIDHALPCHVTTTQYKQLLTVSSNIIKIYTIKKPKIKDENTESDLLDEHDEDLYKPGEDDFTVNKKFLNLELAMTWKSASRIASIKLVRFVGDSLDSILIAIPIAKISVLKFDPALNCLTTRSMHYFEEPHNEKEFNSMGKTIKLGKTEFEPVVRVDPENRCACVLVYGRGLIILPFRRLFSGPQALLDINFASELSSYTEDNDNVTQTPKVLSSYSIGIDSFSGVHISKILDIEFLNGYNNPTLIILYEKELSWTGRTHVRYDTCGALVVSINPAERTNPVVWKTEYLPYDCFKVRAVPMPLVGRFWE